MRFLRSMIFGWFFYDGIRLMMGGELTLYPVWVPIIVLGALYLVTEITLIISKDENR